MTQHSVSEHNTLNLIISGSSALFTFCLTILFMRGNQKKTGLKGDKLRSCTGSWYKIIQAYYELLCRASLEGYGAKKEHSSSPFFPTHIFWCIFSDTSADSGGELIFFKCACHSFELSYVQNIIFPVCKVYFLHKHKTGVANKNWNVSFSALNCCF